MLTNRQVFLNNLAQTSTTPLALEIEKAEGVYLYDNKGKKYIDFISGIAVSNVGHRHPKVIAAIEAQLGKYMHLMVYGEYVQSPQVLLAQKLASLLPKSLSSIYFVNSGSEATEGAMKLAKRYTGRTQIISFQNAYHGSTQGSLSIMGGELFKNAYRPLLPDTLQIEYNSIEELEKITRRTACVVVETIQGEAGALVPSQKFLVALRRRCSDVGALLVLDEVQCGFGRTGSFFAFEQFNIEPDILTIAKGMGGGMPIGAFISSKEIMNTLTNNPVLGHITTFGGHPVSCAASIACIEVIEEENLVEQVSDKEKLIRSLLKNSNIKQIHGRGLLLAVEFEFSAINMKVIDNCIKNGVIVDWFLFADNKMRIAPPLTITKDEIKNACEIIIASIEKSI